MADSDDDDNDHTFVTIGTPLEVYDDDEVVSRKPVSIEDQVVKDAQGRQRFHGAFTGGFSAGYFNTVGSKEGWAPKTFVSSRSQRNEASVGQKPEDFMDEEDLGEFGIAPRIIATKQNFLSNERERKRKAVAVAALSGKSAIPGVESLLVDLILPKKSSIGIRLLRKLGWKEGQGIGPRSRKMQTEQPEDQPLAVSDGRKVYGCMLPPEFSTKEKNLSSEDSDEDYNSVSFAPKDVCPVNFEPKENLHGIGYRGLDPRLALGNFSFQEPAAVTTKVGRRGIRGQAFGVGAFEKDDDDIYSSESMANYDVEITEEKPDSANFGWTGSHQRREDKFIRHETDVLPGFVKAVVAVQPRKNYPPPQLPRDFKPFHKFESQEGSRETQSSTAGQKTLDASTRGVLLGEAPHLNSVFELVSNEDRSKMEAAKMQGEILKKQQQTEPSLDSTKPVSADHRLGSTASTSMATKISALGFKPFAKFPEKQKRYEEYLEAIKHGKTYEPTCGSNTTEWEQEHEREEFAQAARLYRPLAGMIASRFTRAEHGDDDNVTLPPKQDVEKSDKENAASMKMFGKLTRDRFEWHPDKVLCKRFNIANPYPDSTVVGVPSVKRDKYSVFNFLNFPSQDDVPSPPVHVREEPKGAEAVSAKLKPLAILATVDLRPRVQHVTMSADSEVSNTASPSEATEGVVTQSSSDNTTTTATSEADGRPPMDLFKAIFDNSDSDDSDEAASDKEDGAKEPVQPNATVVLPLASANVTPPSDIPREAPLTVASHTKQESDVGFLATSSAHEIAETAKCESSQPEDNQLRSPLTTPSTDTFGPSLPPVATESSSEPLDSHGRHRHHHRRKESHKHKKAKHKKKEKKHKDKKRKKRKEVIKVDSSSSDDADKEDEDTEDDDDIAELDRTLLDRLKTMAARR